MKGLKYCKCSKILNSSCWSKSIDKQGRPKSACFLRSSLIRVFPVCYSDNHFPNYSPATNILFENRKGKVFKVYVLKLPKKQTNRLDPDQPASEEAV